MLFELTLPIVILIQSCSSFSNYVIFNGFGTAKPISNYSRNVDTFSFDVKTEEPVTPSTSTNSATQEMYIFIDNSSIIEHSTIMPETVLNDLDERSSVITAIKFKCPEEEKPSNIGPYMIPTERDLVLHVGKILARMYGNYHRRSLSLLNDIKEASKATKDIENSKCFSVDKIIYRQCVKRVSTQFRLLTKTLVSNMEMQKQYILDLIEGKICTLDELPKLHLDPIDLMRNLAVESISLQLGLPGFLRTLGSCAVHCKGAMPLVIKRKEGLNDFLMKYMLSERDYKAIQAKMEELNI